MNTSMSTVEERVNVRVSKVQASLASGMAALICNSKSHSIGPNRDQTKSPKLTKV